ncbi:MAG: multicopper oxidase domain-containing protein [Candidatus Bathyarchaeota archaeon]|nr:multicopper oxidase domain-containing protein [Candidatus Bathyarchaeota archaeon]
MKKILTITTIITIIFLLNPLIIKRSSAMPADGEVPHYFGPYPNYATSQLPTVTRDAQGNIINVEGGIRKFVDSLPGLGPAGANNLGQYIPIAVPDTTTFPGCDYYEIAVVQFQQQFHSDLAPSTLRGYVQLETSVNIGSSAHFALTYPNGSPILNAVGQQVKSVDRPRYLGPLIVAQRDRPVRVKFTNFLPTGTGGDLFLPVDTTVMGSGMGPLDMPGMPGMKESYTQNRATLHLHGGNTPWISDGTAHQWTTPAGETTQYPKGVSVQYVPDMWFVNGNVVPNTVGQTTAPVTGATNNPGAGSLTFYYTNQQSARLLFYHDHAYGITRLNVYAGEAAGYLIQDETEQALINSGLIPANQIPLIIQDKTFVPDTTTPITNMWGTFPSQLGFQDPTWNIMRWGGTGSLWYPHVYMTMQNPGDPTGMNQFGRWQYGPWFWPPVTPTHGPVANPYYNPLDPNNPMEPPLIPGVPNISAPGEAFMDTPVINGIAYPYLTVQPQAYRFRILNAADDRSWNLQFYVADSSVTTFDGRTNTEVKMVPATYNPSYPADWPKDGRDGGVPDPANIGPSFIQIGTEGGFLPSPVVLPTQPVDWNWNQGDFDFGILLKYTLLLAPAERADVIVDFSQFAGKTLILYNDCPAPVPAADPRLDYYTDNVDQTDTGGAPSTIAGYGPNTRTIMQIRVAATTPSPAFNVDALNAAFVSTTTTPGVFAKSQNPIIVPQAAYGDAYNQVFTDVYGKIFDNSLTFKPLNSGTPVTMPLQSKSMHDEMGGAYEIEYGRMSVQLGVEQPKSTPFTQTTILYNFADPPTELIAPSIAGTKIATLNDGTQIWRITHNGVDVHPMHWHMYDVQLINRVAWDNHIRPPDPNELGWKDTVRINPLQDTYIALRPIVPTLPFDVPNNIRLIDPTMPAGATLKTPGFIVDPTGQAITLTNHLVNYGWEYTWHCHILAHEEMDAMRPVAVAVPPWAPYGLSVTRLNNIPTYRLTWTDNSLSETQFKVQRSTGTAESWVTIATLTSTTGPTKGTTKTYDDRPPSGTTTYYYRVIATNVVGDTFDYTTTNPNAVGFPTLSVDSPPSNIASTGTALGDVFTAVRGSGVGEIYQRSYVTSSNTWSAWTALPLGSTSDTPAVAVVGAREYFVVRGSDGLSLYFGSRNIPTGAFSGWTWMPGSTPSAPTLVTDGYRRLALVVRGSDNKIYYNIYDVATQLWSNWQVLPAGLTSEKPTAALVDGKLYIVVRGITVGSNVLYFGSVDVSGGAFSGWAPLAGSTPSAPVLTTLHTTQGLCLAVRGDNNIIYLNRWNGAIWQGWTAIPSGSTPSSPAISVYTNRLHFVVVGMDGTSLYYNWMNLNTNAMSTWTALAGSSPSPPTMSR